MSSISSLKIKAKLLQKTKKAAGNAIPLKDALQIIAKAQGYAGWRELKTEFEKTEHFFAAPSSHYWKTWYTRYDEALAHLEKSEGFLLPYRKQFLICDIHYIEHLGISANDPDLKTVGRNWVEPQDANAWQRILGKIKK